MPRLPRNDLAAERLRELIHYNPETGFFGWRVTRGQQVAGSRAGKKVAFGYWRVMVDKHPYFLHRLAWLYVYGRWPNGVIHHRNRDPSDNKISNLEDISQKENLKFRIRAAPVILSADPAPPCVDDWWTRSEREHLKNALTASRLRELLIYDRDTGIFRRRGRRGNRLAGCVAGYIGFFGYRLLAINGKRYYEQRLAWLYVHDEWPTMEIDHINGKRDDNRIINLREATRSQNMCNRSVKGSSLSGFKGISFDKRRGTWSADAGGHGQRLRKSGFATAKEAHAAYIEMARKLHGEFALSR